MRKTLLMTTGLAWLALTGAAGAVTSLTEGPQDPQGFAAEAAGLDGFTINGATWTDVGGLADTEKGSLLNQFAAPLGMGNTTYMTVFGGGTEQVSFATPQTSIVIYWGSIDPGNTVTINGQTVTGADLVALGATDDGSQTEPSSNALVRISGLGTFTTATFSTNQNSFEFSIAAVPEPATWAMMMFGFAGLGYAAFRRTSKGRALAI